MSKKLSATDSDGEYSPSDEVDKDDIFYTDNEAEVNDDRPVSIQSFASQERPIPPRGRLESTNWSSMKRAQTEMELKINSDRMPTTGLMSVNDIPKEDLLALKTFFSSIFSKRTP